MKQDRIIKLMLATFILLVFSSIVLANVPTKPTFDYNNTETIIPKADAYLNTSGGSFTTLVLNATAQNYKWKAYVGNATGKLALSDQDNYSIYDWDLSTISGNVYVSRYNNISWSNLVCAQRSTIDLEDYTLNISATAIDNINNTFNETSHKEFYAASKQITASQCPSISTYINGSSQSSGESNLFQEVLLEDTNGYLIYSTILEDTIQGFDGGFYDFQMIVADDQSVETNTNYYFYLELV